MSRVSSAVVVLSLVCAAAITGCAKESGAGAGADSTSPMVERRSDGVLIASAESLRKIPGYVVDSVFPPDEALRRFRAEPGSERVDSLSGGATNVRALFEAYVAALQSRDSLAVRALVMTRAEYGWLYFDGSPEQKSGLMPQTAWGLMESRSNSGLGRAAGRITALGSVRLTGAACGPDRIKTGVGRIDGPCTITVQPATGAAETIPVARFVFTHRNRVKLVSFANDL